MGIELIILLSVLGIATIGAVYLYNQFIRWKNMMREAWSGIDVQLKRRYDLIPNLVEIVKGYGNYEKTLFEDIARLRTESLRTSAIDQKSRIENELSQSLKTIFAVAENYPELKANGNYLQLQKDLAEVEDQLQYARRYYNGTVKNYNILVESFPSLIIANLAGFRSAVYFEVESAAERRTPQITLG